MFRLKLSTIPLITTSLVALITSPALAAPIPRGKESLDSQMPAESRHTFVPIKKEWTCEISYLTSDNIVIKPADRDPKVNDYRKEMRYFEQGKLRKIVTYFPDGAIAREIDKDDKDQFTIDRYPNGDVSHFTHWHDGTLPAGYSVSPDGRTIHVLAHGKGELVSYGTKAGNRIHTWYWGGHQFLEKCYRNDACIEVRLDCGDDTLCVDRQGEHFIGWGKRDCWDKPVGGKPYRSDVGISSGWPDEDEIWAKQYATRRSEFIDAFGKLLKDARKSWEVFEIDFIHTVASWPH
jgi:hypothetical protein